MKKQLIIPIVVLSMYLGACGTEEKAPEATTTQEVQTEVETKVSKEGTESEAETTKEADDSQVISDFEDLTVVDNEECTIKITGIDSENIFGYTLNTYLENKSSDKTYMFSATNAAINGVQCDPIFASEVASGKKSNDEITFTNNHDIGEFTDIEISFRVYDSDDWMADAVAEETVHIYPYGEENATTFIREPQNTDNIIIDNDYITVIVTGYEHDDIWGYSVNLFLTNKSDKEIMLSVDNASVNGYMADPFFATSVMPGKCSFSSITWSDSVLEENNISDIEEIEISFRAYDNNEFMSDDFVNEVITLSP